MKAKLHNVVNLDTNIRLKKMDNAQQGELDFLRSSRIIHLIHDLVKTVIQWLSAPDTSTNRNDANKKQEKGTCSWFLESEQFLTWLESPGFIWVKGNGKPFCSLPQAILFRVIT